MKKRLEKIVNGAVNVSANVAAATGVLEVMDYMKDVGTSDTASYLTGIAGGIGLYELNRSGLMKKAVKKTTETFGKIKGKAAPYIKAVALTSAITAATLLAKDRISDVYNDFTKTEEVEPEEKIVRTAPKSLDTHVGGFYTLQNTDNPSALIELGFMSNKNDLEFYKTKREQKRAAEAIADGICSQGEKYDKKKATLAGGHGENYPGAVSPDGKTTESEIVKKVTEYAVEELEDRGWEVQHLWYTGPREGKKGQRKRVREYVDKSNDLEDSFYVEIHMNSVGSPNTAVTRVYGPSPKAKNPKSHELAQSILDELNKTW